MYDLLTSATCPFFKGLHIFFLLSFFCWRIYGYHISSCGARTGLARLTDFSSPCIPRDMDKTSTLGLSFFSSRVTGDPRRVHNLSIVPSHTPCHKHKRQYHHRLSCSVRVPLWAYACHAMPCHALASQSLSLSASHITYRSTPYSPLLYILASRSSFVPGSWLD